MKKIEKYLEQIQQKVESIFPIDSLHTRKRTLLDAEKNGIVVTDKKKNKLIKKHDKR